MVCARNRIKIARLPGCCFYAQTRARPKTRPKRDLPPCGSVWLCVRSSPGFFSRRLAPLGLACSARSCALPFPGQSGQLSISSWIQSVSIQTDHSRHSFLLLTDIHLAGIHLAVSFGVNCQVMDTPARSAASAPPGLAPMIFTPDSEVEATFKKEKETSTSRRERCVNVLLIPCVHIIIHVIMSVAFTVDGNPSRVLQEKLREGN